MSEVRSVDRVVIRFAGDSGDGMQLTGDRFTSDTAQLGNDFSTLPNFPAEIRAPAGTVAGVSSFQVHFADFDIRTPGDRPDVLVVMNPAALKANLTDLPRGAVILADTADFNTRNLAKVGYTSNPLEDGTLDGYELHALDLTGLAVAAVAPFGLGRKDSARTKNMYALGLLTWLYSRPVQGTLDFLARKFAGKPDIRDANIAAFKAGHAFGETTEVFTARYQIAPAPMPSGTYRQITGNTALAYGLMAGAAKAGLQLFLGAYPITPASDVLHILSRTKDHGVVTFQAEDEIAAVGAALGASYAGALGVTSTSGPGMALKMETISLAVMLELPLVICDIQRAGPATGMPTKTEQADLLPGDLRTARRGAASGDRRPVPGRLLRRRGGGGPDRADLPDAGDPAVRRLPGQRRRAVGRCRTWPTCPRSTRASPPSRRPTVRSCPTAATRSWPGRWRCRARRAWNTGSAASRRPPAPATSPTTPTTTSTWCGCARRRWTASPTTCRRWWSTTPSGKATVLVVGWGSTYGPISAAARRVRLSGRSVATLHLRHLSPLPNDLGGILRAYDRVIVPEMNLGQLAMILRARYLVDCESYSRVRGLPISLSELAEDLLAIIDGKIGIDAKDQR